MSVPTPEDTREACKVLALFRKRLRNRSMLDEDMDKLAEVLVWLEEMITSDEAKA